MAYLTLIWRLLLFKLGSILKIFTKENYYELLLPKL